MPKVKRQPHNLLNNCIADAVNPLFSNMHTTTGIIPENSKLLTEGITAASMADVLSAEEKSRVEQYSKMPLMDLFAHCQKNPTDSIALAVLSKIYLENKEYPKAVNSLYNLIRTDPGNAEWLTLFGMALMMAGAPQQAVPYLKQAIVLKQDSFEAWMGLGHALAKSCEPMAALKAYERAQTIFPRSPVALTSCAWGCQWLGRLGEAAAYADLAMMYEPNFVEAHIQNALIQFQMGQWSRAWQDYEYRFVAGRLGVKYADKPQWNGRQDLSGKKVLVWNDQGFGDMIQWCRFLPILTDLGAEVSLECPTAVHRILWFIEEKWGIKLIGEKEGVSQFSGNEFDYHIPLLSVPGRINLEITQVPPTPTEFAIKREEWRESKRELFAKYETNLPKVGVCWQGDPRHVWDCYRSVELRDILSVIRRHVQVFNLQMGVGMDQWESFPPNQRPVDLICHDVSKWDFADTAGLMLNLDAVITIDSAIAHLAGSLGIPTFMLTSAAAEWRWGVKAEKTIWYGPNFNLIRQKSFGNWEEAVDRAVRGVLYFWNHKSLES